MRKRSRTDIGPSLFSFQATVESKTDKTRLNPRVVRKLFFLMKQGRILFPSLKRKIVGAHGQGQALHLYFLRNLHRKKKERQDFFEQINTSSELKEKEEKKNLKTLMYSISPHLQEIWRESFSRVAFLREEVVTGAKSSIKVPVSAVSLFTLRWFRNYSAKGRQEEANVSQLFDVIQAQLAKQFDMRTPTIVRDLARKVLDRVCSYLGAVFFEEKKISFQALDQTIQTISFNIAAFAPIRDLIWMDNLAEDVCLCFESCEINLKHGDPKVRTFFLHITSSLLRNVNQIWSTEELTHGALSIFQSLIEDEIEVRLARHAEGQLLTVSKDLIQKSSKHQIRPWMKKQAAYVSQFLLDLTSWIEETLPQNAVQESSLKNSLVHFLKTGLGRSNRSLKNRQLSYSLFVYLLQVHFLADGELSHLEKTEYGILFFLLSSHKAGNIETDWLLHVWAKEMVLSFDPIMHLACAIRDFAENSPLSDGKMSPQLCQSILYLAIGYGIFHGKESFRIQLLSDTMRLTRAIRSLPFQGIDPFAFGPIEGRSRVISVMHALVEGLLLFFQDVHFDSMRDCLQNTSVNEKTSFQLTSFLSGWIGYFPGSLAWDALLSYYKLHRLFLSNTIEEERVQEAIHAQIINQFPDRGAVFLLK